MTRTNYEAYAEIVLLTPEQAAHEPRAINAADVISHIGPEAAPRQSRTRPKRAAATNSLIAIARGHAVHRVAFAMAHVRNIHHRQRIVGQHHQHCAGREPRQRFLRQHRGQRAFEAAQVQRLVHAPAHLD